ncbi:hypothetical protein ACJMK2_008341 [Sinanodonta woodiana]|uniref:Reelin domain-containing protein n=1 Tax=Sinanodonta woodiana TaxID=1069815 RepID=A0ABD3VLA8_SINWO
MFSSRRGVRATIQIILTFGYTAYLIEAMIPLSIHQERQRHFPKGSEVFTPNYQVGDHLRTGMRHGEASRQRQKTVLANTGQIKVKFVCDGGRMMSTNNNGTLVPPQKTRSPFEILVNSTQISPYDIIKVTITSTGRETFRGFFLQILSLTSSVEKEALFPQGRFLPGEQTTVASCVSAGDSVFQADGSMKKTVSFLWKASNFISGLLRIRGSIVQDKDTYWEKVLSKPINVITDPKQEDKSQNRLQSTQVDTLNISPAKTFPPSSITSNLITNDTSIRKYVYKRDTTINTVFNATAASEENPLSSQETGDSHWNGIQSEKSKQDELTKSVAFSSRDSFGDLLLREGNHIIEGGGDAAATHSLNYQEFPTVNISQMSDSVGPLGNLVAPPETSEVLANALKSVIGGGGGLGTMINAVTVFSRIKSLMGKRKSAQASNMNGFGGMMGGGPPMGALGGMGNSLMGPQSSLLALQQQVQALQQQLALQTSQLALQNQLGFQNPLLGVQNPFGLQNSQLGLQNPQLGLGMQGQTNPLMGLNQFGTGGLQLDNLAQNQLGQFMPGQGMGGMGQQLNSQWSNPIGVNQFGGSDGMGSGGSFGGMSNMGGGGSFGGMSNMGGGGSFGGMSNMGGDSSFGQSNGGAFGGSPSSMFGGQPSSFMAGGGGNAGIGTGLFG